MQATNSGLLAALEADPGDDTAWLALGDWLEENNQPDHAELVRLTLSLRRPGQDKRRPEWERRVQQLVGEGVRPVVPTRQVRLTRKVPLLLTLLPPGTFVMGSGPDEDHRDGDEGPLHQVSITRAFWMGAFLVTQAQWSALMNTTPSTFRGAPATHPVEGVNWEDSQAFCAKVSERLGQKVRLATEAEWEYACRAGTSSTFFFGPTISSEQANYKGSEVYRPGDPLGPDRQTTTPVNAFAPNAFGIHDLHGNLWEWCQDWFEARYYRVSPERDPPGPDEGRHRVCRGGAWFNPPGYLRSASRAYDLPGTADRYTGFRVVMER